MWRYISSELTCAPADARAPSNHGVPLAPPVSLRAGRHRRPGSPLGRDVPRRRQQPGRWHRGFVRRRVARSAWRRSSAIMRRCTAAADHYHTVLRGSCVVSYSAARRPYVATPNFSTSRPPPPPTTRHLPPPPHRTSDTPNFPTLAVAHQRSLQDRGHGEVGRCRRERGAVYPGRRRLARRAAARALPQGDRRPRPRRQRPPSAHRREHRVEPGETSTATASPPPSPSSPRPPP